MFIRIISAHHHLSRNRLNLSKLQSSETLSSTFLSNFIVTFAFIQEKEEPLQTELDTSGCPPLASFPLSPLEPSSSRRSGRKNPLLSYVARFRRFPSDQGGAKVEDRKERSRKRRKSQPRMPSQPEQLKAYQFLAKPNKPSIRAESSSPKSRVSNSDRSSKSQTEREEQLRC